ncbi:Ca-activated chloride channel family protein [Pseudomonas duriflava]|uniref:Ca-activated chloride channel family protein n=1 Tax=Pseudomonas duriflava TaxID=459528 RepID=A0A562QAX9_9PSED|nr:VWA domain-containing protein [Pseudomonas duriflava]TWI53873.1 Ca-activated chloride channel family protein [Pseudomonas duriflava]
MTFLLPHLSRPLWLLALPVLAWIVWKLWHRPHRSGYWQSLLPEAFQPWLLTTADSQVQRLPVMLFGLGSLLALLALSGPSWQREAQPAFTRADPLVIVLDMTVDMLAADTPPSRLVQARHKILDLLATRRDAETAIVVYAGSAHTLVPLTNDLHTARNLLEAVRPSIMPESESGERADLAIRQAQSLLRNGAGNKGRLLLITSRLTTQEQTGLRAALAADRVPLLILGAGTPEGAPMPREDGTYFTDGNGSILLSRLDESGLAHFARSLGASYQRISPDQADLQALGLLTTPDAVTERSEQVHLDTWVDQGYWLLLPLIILVACAGRRGWLLCLPLLVTAPPPAEAFDFQDLWLRRNQQGARLLEAQRPAEAAERFEDRQWRGVAQYEAGDYEGAAKTFATGNSAADHYNRGNALAQAGQLTGALDAYDQALARQPDFPAATHNRALVEALLQQRQEAENNNSSDNPGETEPETPPDAGTSSMPMTGPDEDSQSTDRSSLLNSEESAETRTGVNQGKNASEEDDGASGIETPSPAPLTTLSEERRQALEQWLREIPDDPAELLQRKFRYQQQQRQENPSP